MEIKKMNLAIFTLIFSLFCNSCSFVSKRSTQNINRKKNASKVKLANKDSFSNKRKTTHSLENISTFEINVNPSNFSSINNKNYKVTSIDFSSLAKDLSDQSTDEIKTTIASIEKKPIEDTDDLKVFDYSDKTNEDTNSSNFPSKKIFDAPLSSSVKNAITREISSSKPILNELNFKNKTSNTINNKKENKNTAQAFSQLKEQVNKDESLNFTSKKSTSAYYGKEINFITKKNVDAIGFDFIPDFDKNEIISDQNSGEIEFKEQLNGLNNILTGVFNLKNAIPTRTEINLNEDTFEEIPFLNENSLHEFLKLNKTYIEGNLLLVSTSDEIKDIELDAKFTHKLQLDENFNLIETISNTQPAYFLFAGIKSGNILIKYYLNKNESAQKVIFIGDGELYYERSNFTSSSRKILTLNTRNILGNKNKELIINNEDLIFFNSKIKSKQLALNAYELKIPFMPSGMSPYFEFSHLKNTILVGTKNETLDLEIPTNEFISKSMEYTQTNSVKENCLLQINFKKDPISFTANGKNKLGDMYLETNFLDHDGNFSSSSDFSEKAFLKGDLEGIINVKIEYEDHSVEYLKTFCALNNYLVEQL